MLEGSWLARGPVNVVDDVVAQSIQLLKHWLYNVQSSIVVEKIWALSVDQHWLHALQFSVYRINLLRKFRKL